MAFESHITTDDDWFVGEDKTITHYIMTGKPIRVREGVAAGGTTVLVDPLKEALSNTQKIRLGDQIVTLAADADVGDNSITVSALTGAIQRGAILYKVQDITGWSFTWRLKTSPGASSNVLSKTPAISSAANGVAVTTIDDTDTDAVTPGKYYHALWRTNAGSETVLSYGEATLRRAA